MRTILIFLRATLALLLVVANTALHASVLFAATLLRAVAPTPPLRRACGAGSAAIAESWIGVNGRLIDAFARCLK